MASGILASEIQFCFHGSSRRDGALNELRFSFSRYGILNAKDSTQKQFPDCTLLTSNGFCPAAQVKLINQTLINGGRLNSAAKSCNYFGPQYPLWYFSKLIKLTKLQFNSNAFCSSYQSKSYFISLL